MPSSYIQDRPVEQGRAVAPQMLNEPDGSPLGPAEQSGEPSLAFDQRQAAEIVAVVLDQISRLPSYLASAPESERNSPVRAEHRDASTWGMLCVGENFSQPLVVDWRVLLGPGRPDQKRSTEYAELVCW
jgi:hypothetical protein